MGYTLISSVAKEYNNVIDLVLPKLFAVTLLNEVMMNQGLIFQVNI